MKARSKRNPRLRRTDGQRQRDLVDVAGWLADGMSQQEILPLLNESRPYKISRTQLVYDVAEIRRNWRADAVEKIDALIAEEIAIVRSVRRKAFIAWEDSRTHVKKDKAGREKRGGDAAFLHVVLKCNERICKMRGIEERIQEPDAPEAIPEGDPAEKFQATFGMTVEQADERLRKQIEHETREKIAAERRSSDA